MNTVDFLRYKFKSRFNPNPNRLPAISGYQNFIKPAIKPAHIPKYYHIRNIKIFIIKKSPQKGGV
jgi:hypothetical protein